MIRESVLIEVECADSFCHEPSTVLCHLVAPPRSDERGQADAWTVTVPACEGHADRLEKDPGRWCVSVHDGRRPTIEFRGP